MQQRRACQLILFLMTLLLAGCTASPAEDVAVQEVLLETDFSEAADWPEALDVEAGTAVQRTDNGYELSSVSAAYAWGFSDVSYEDVILETAVRQLSPEANNAYGLVCRGSSNDNQNGYYFLISGDGLVSIRRVSRNISSPVVDWQPHSAVRKGERNNELRAVCAGTYLAFYVNGQLVAEGEDGRFSKGVVGFAASGSEDGAVQVTFTKLVIRAAQISRQ